MQKNWIGKPGARGGIAKPKLDVRGQLAKINFVAIYNLTFFWLIDNEIVIGKDNFVR